jgi:hypothetical protein
LLLISFITLATAATTETAFAGQGGVQYPAPSYGRYAAPDSAIRFDVKPKQAQVFVDGFYAGIVDDFSGTFGRLRLPPGEHEITVYLDGYHSIREKVYLTPDNTLKIKREMDKLLAGEQPDARPEPPPLPPPPQAPGTGSQQPPPYQPPGRGQGGRRAPLPPPPPPDPNARPADASQPGTLTLQVQPPDADVYIDGQRWRGQARQDGLSIDLPEGRHTIELQKAGYRTYITDVDIRHGEATPLTVAMRQDQP